MDHGSWIIAESLCSDFLRGERNEFFCRVGGKNGKEFLLYAICHTLCTSPTENAREIFAGKAGRQEENSN